MSDEDEDGNYDDFSLGFEITHYPSMMPIDLLQKLTHSRIESGDSSGTDMIFMFRQLSLML